MTKIDVVVREVGMRDGLQSIKFIMPTDKKLEWARRETEAGVTEIEVASFVPPKLLPQMADAAEVVRGALEIPGLTVSALVPNLKGAERAVEQGAHKLNCVMSVSEKHNQANVRRSVQESIDEFGRIVGFVRGLPSNRRPQMCAGLATSFGCTIEGDVPEAHVLTVVEKVAALGVDEMAIADTVGYGNPAQVRRIFSGARKIAGKLPIAAHFHDTRGLGLANVVAALDAGVTAFDASLGGFGGCPYAPGASGNVDMEDLVFMLESMGLKTGVDLARLLEVRKFIESVLPTDTFAGAVAVAGLPKNYRSAASRAAA
ncbi:MAG: hydroxymethylglutaryl-CoA lyase [Alphaproteobacteria bacterium]|nr:hydroxymethylglutaryl-CoA lyase [Alphaproteobacteria bacterium]